VIDVFNIFLNSSYASLYYDLFFLCNHISSHLSARDNYFHTVVNRHNSRFFLKGLQSSASDLQQQKPTWSNIKPTDTNRKQQKPTGSNREQLGAQQLLSCQNLTILQLSAAALHAIAIPPETAINDVIIS
jgi:hypothetical protein